MKSHKILETQLAGVFNCFPGVSECCWLQFTILIKIENGSISLYRSASKIMRIYIPNIAVIQFNSEKNPDLGTLTAELLTGTKSQKHLSELSETSMSGVFTHSFQVSKNRGIEISTNMNIQKHRRNLLFVQGVSDFIQFQLQSGNLYNNHNPDLIFEIFSCQL